MKSIIFFALSLIFLTNVYAASSDFPDVFIDSGKFNGIIVVGNQASASDVIAQSNLVQFFIEYTGTTIKGTTKLSSEVSDLNQNIISIGSPCINPVSASILNNPGPCDKGIVPSKPIIKLFKTNEFYHMVIAGYTDKETRQAITDIVNGNITIHIESVPKGEAKPQEEAEQKEETKADEPEIGMESEKQKMIEELNKKISENKFSENKSHEIRQEFQVNDSTKQKIEKTAKQKKETKSIVDRLIKWISSLFKRP